MVYWHINRWYLKGWSWGNDRWCCGDRCDSGGCGNDRCGDWGNDRWHLGRLGQRSLALARLGQRSLAVGKLGQRSLALGRLLLGRVAHQSLVLGRLVLGRLAQRSLVLDEVLSACMVEPGFGNEELSLHCRKNSENTELALVPSDISNINNLLSNGRAITNLNQHHWLATSRLPPSATSMASDKSSFHQQHHLLATSRGSPSAT